jgi:hypothetical protein
MAQRFGAISISDEGERYGIGKETLGGEKVVTPWPKSFDIEPAMMQPGPLQVGGGFHSIRL